MPNKKAGKVLLPPRVVKADDFPVVIGGETYHPLEGETISYRNAVSPQTLVKTLRLKSLAFSVGPDTSEDEVTGKLMELGEFLAGRITGWTLTDMDTGEPLPEPTAEVIIGLDMKLIGFLLTNVVAPSENVTDRGNDSTPSTFTSDA